MDLRFRMLAAWLLAEMMLAAAIDEAHAAGDVQAGSRLDKSKAPHVWHSHGDEVLEPVTIVPAVPPFITNLGSDEAAYQHHQRAVQAAMDTTTHRNAVLLDLGGPLRL